MRLLVLGVLVCSYTCWGLPVRQGEAQVKEKHDDNARQIPNMDREEYIRYVQELARSDPEFMERLSRVEGLDLPKLQEMIANHPHLRDRLLNKNERNGMRNQVDEARRITVEQMRQLQKLQTMRNDNLLKEGDWMTKEAAHREKLPADFSNQDIQAKLKEAQQRIEELDRVRKQDFKQQEMWEEHRRRQKLREMNEQQRLKAEDEFRKKHDELKKHERLPQPASKEQLEQVWEEEDGMAKEEFDARTFFHMHDTNADRTLDPMEVEALFYSELKKVYKDDMDGTEAHEDLARMREYAMSEIDKNKDGMISFDEFMVYTEGKLYEEKKEWHPIVDEDQPFSDKEFEDYEEDYEEDYDYEYDDKGNIIGIRPRKHPDQKQPDQQAGEQPSQHEQSQPPQQPEGQQGNQPPQHQGGQPSQGSPQQGSQPPQHQGSPDSAPQGVPDPSQRKGEEGPPPGAQIDDPNSLHVQPVQQQEQGHEDKMVAPSDAAGQQL